jgi:hypothetical protein
MIGYLSPSAPTTADRGVFRSYQCSLCHHLGREYGPFYRFFANADMVFLNAWRDGVALREAKVGRRACVVAPLITSLPVRGETDNTAFAAAFGVYMAVAKLEDDWADDRDYLRGFGAWALRSGKRRARAVLAAAGLSMEAIEAQMRAQSALEAGGEVALDVAAAPTRAIAALGFGALPVGADPALADTLSEAGAALGGFLFFADNSLDLAGDLRAGRYNALARAAGLHTADAAGEQAAVELGVTAAEAEVGHLDRLLTRLPSGPLSGFLRRTLVTGFRNKLARLAALPAEARPAARFAQLLPPRPDLLTRVRAQVAPRWRQAPLRFQMAAAFLLVALFPRSAWAASWWPAGADPEVGDPEAIDPALMAEADETSGTSDCGTICDPCAGSFGWISCAPENCCDDACEGACTNT